MIRDELIEAAARAIANDIAGQEDPRFKVPDVWDLTLPWLDQGTVDFRLTATAVIDLIAPEVERKTLERVADLLDDQGDLWPETIRDLPSQYAALQPEDRT